MRSSSEEATLNKRPTIRDVAARAGVSKSLVSLAYAKPDTVSEGRRDRIFTAADELGFRPNHAARSLAGTDGGFVALLVADLHNPLFAEIVDGARAALAEAGEVSLMTSAVLPQPTPHPDLDRRLLGLFHDLRPRGVLIVGSVPDMAEIAPLAFDVPIVVASANPEGLPQARTVRGDDFAGMQLAVQHLADQGHERIAHIGGEGGGVSTDRAAAYQRIMTSLGLASAARIEPCDFSETAGFNAAARLLDSPEPPTAIAAVNDLSAVGAMAAIAAHYERTGERIALTGYDNTFLAGLRQISLTTVDPDNAAIGRIAANLLVSDPDDVSSNEHLAPPRLVVRESSATKPPTLNG